MEKNPNSIGRLVTAKFAMTSNDYIKLIWQKNRNIDGRKQKGQVQLAGSASFNE